MKIDLQEIKQGKTLKELLEFGIININKPSGPTSFTVSDFVRRTLKEFGVKKSSHFGTLDPRVTGVLPVALNRACKLTGFFIGEDKEYVGIMRFHERIETDKVKDMIKKKFIGNIKQTPPKKSRVKRVERQREIKRFEILEQSENGKDILFLAEVQGGTYIRKLVDDLGKEIGIGAHMLELRRIRAGIFKEDDAEYPSVDLYELEKACDEAKDGDEKHLRNVVIPGEVISKIYPVVEIRDTKLKQIFTGKPIQKDDLKEKSDFDKFEKDNNVCIFCNGQFVEIAKIISEKEIFSKPEFVFQRISN